MALHITRRDIEEAHRYARDSVGRLQSSRQSAGVGGKVVRSAEVLAGAAGVGILSGYFGPLMLGNTPVPLDLAAGVAGHLLAFTGLAGSFSDHLHNVSDGIMAGYAMKFGVGYGKSLAQKSGRPISPVFSGVGGQQRQSRGIGDAVKGALGGLGLGGAQVFTGAEPLSEAELAAMAQAVR